MPCRMRILLFIWFCLICPPLSGQNPFPSYREVVNNFCDNYSAEPERFRLEKHADGYYAAFLRQSGQQALMVEKFWSAETGRYVPLTQFTKKEADANSEGLRRKLLGGTLEFEYNICPVFGYPGWSDEVIEALDGKPDLKDTLVCALGRAFNTAAFSVLMPNYQFAAIPKEPLFIPPGQNALAPIVLAKYRDLQRKAVECDYRLWRLNPNFKTIVGNSRTEYANQVMTGFVYLRFFQDFAEASQELRPDLYTPELLIHARNLLLSCPPNAILLTWGDTDTYSTIYLQAVEKLRPDVAIANLGLLETGRYINFLKKPQPNGYEVPLAGKNEFYEPTKGIFVLIRHISNQDTLPWRDWLSQAEAAVAAIPDTAATPYATVPSNFIRIPLSAGAPEKDFIFPVKDFMTPMQIALLDMLATAGDKRPLCLSVTVDESEFQLWIPHLQWRGLLYTFKAEKDASLPKSPPMPDPDSTFHLLMQVFGWPEPKTSGAVQPDASLKSFTQSLDFTVYTCAKTYIAQGNKNKAIQVLDKYLSVYQTPTSLDYYFQMYFADLLAQAGEVARSKSICIALLQFMREHPAEKAKADGKATLNGVWYLADRYQWPDVLEMLKAQ